MPLSISQRPALLLIDIQKGFDDIEYWGGERNNPEAEQNCSDLLKIWRKNSLPIFHIKHCSTNHNSPLRDCNKGNQFKDLVSPLSGENIVKKHVNSAFIGTTLRASLKRNNVSTLVMVGLTTDHCVSTTARMAGNYGFDTYLVADAMATFCKKGMDGMVFPASLIHETALASLREEFATITTTKELTLTFQEHILT